MLKLNYTNQKTKYTYRDVYAFVGQTYNSENRKTISSTVKIYANDKDWESAISLDELFIDNCPTTSTDNMPKQMYIYLKTLDTFKYAIDHIIPIKTEEPVKQ